MVFVTARRTLERERARIRATLLAIRDGVRTVAADPAAAVAQIAHEAQTTDTGLIAAELKAVQPIFAGDLRLDRGVLDRWADFDARIGIVVDGERYLGVLTLATIGTMIRSEP